MGFSRRFADMPGVDVLSAIEGIVIIDNPPPGAVRGVGVGTACIVGEFADMTYAVQASAAGVISTKPQPREIFSNQDLLQQFGGWDSTIGDFGVSGGNGFAELKGKSFSRLVVVPVNLASGGGVRLVRELPTNTSATNPEPAVALTAATVQAATEFKTGTSRIKHGARFTFKSTAAYKTGIDGSVAAVAGTATGGYVESAVGPFDLRSITLTTFLRVAFNAGGNQDFNLSAVAAVVTGSGGAAAAMSNETMEVKIGSGPWQTITFTTEATQALALAAANTQLEDGRFQTEDANNAKIVSDKKGTSARVQTRNVAAGITTKLGIANNADQSGSGDVADLGAVTAAETVAKLSTLTNGTAAVVAGKVRLTSATTGVLGTATVAAASTADGIYGGDFATNATGTGTAAGAGGGTSLNFDSAGGDFLNPDVATKVKVGDALVVGVIGAAGAQGDNAFTLRVRSITSATRLVVEKQDGSSFNWTTGTDLAWRLHTAAVADSGGETAVDGAGGYVLPARPIDATVAAATAVSPTVPAAAGTATTWDPASGLKLITHPTAGLVYTAAVQAPNAVAHSSIDALYSLALDALVSDQAPASEVNIVHAARTSSSIRSKLKSSVLSFVGQGVGRCAIVWPELNVIDPSTVLGTASPGVGATRDERVFYCWPHIQLEITEAVNTPVQGADGFDYDDGIVDMPAAGKLLSGLSLLAPERNPGQPSDPMKTVMADIKGFARGTPTLAMSHYIQMKAKGVVGVRNDRVNGFIFQSGVTSSLTSGRLNINRRRMADYIQDSVGEALAPWAKEPMSEKFKAGTTQLVENFLAQLLSKDNTAMQRITGYEVDVVTGNNAELEAAGIWVIIGRVRTTPTADAIVFSTEIGEGVVITKTN